MVPSDVVSLAARLGASRRRLEALIAVDRDAIVAPATEMAANDLIAEAVATVTGDADVEALRLEAIRAPLGEREPVLARDLLIGVTLAEHALHDT